jgi:hemolysin activation/secretion protein
MVMKNIKQAGWFLFSVTVISLLSIRTGCAADLSGQGSLAWDPGMQLNQTRNYLEQQQRLAQLQADKEKKLSAVESGIQKEKEQQEGQLKELTFTLKQVTFDSSMVLGQAELDGVTKEYIGKTSNLQTLYAIVNKINSLYSQKGYIVCKAYLPPQTIHEGKVHIGLMEGKTSNVIVSGNKSTRTGYITDRLPLETGKVANFDGLNKGVLLFNGTNDEQLRVKIKAGEKTGTTDYEIAVYEPQRQHAYVLVDTAGSESTGIWREGAGWYTRSLTGNRDNLNIYFMRSDGTKSGSFSYSIPISNRGTRFGVQYSANSIQVKHGALSDLDVRGHASLYAFNLTQPLRVTANSRLEAGLEWSRQHSRTDFADIAWIDDTLSRWTASISATNYSAQNIWYQRHGYSWGNWEDINDEHKSYGKYNFDFLAQHLFANRQVFTARLAAQVSGNHYLPSADQFYIGGVNTVRGYKENILSGDSGYALNLEYAIPDRRNTEWFLFWDMGSVYGDNAFDDHSLMSAGFGYRVHIANKVNATLALGIPFKKELNDENQSNCRLHFALYSEF